MTLEKLQLRGILRNCNMPWQFAKFCWVPTSVQSGLHTEEISILVAYSVYV